MGFPNHIFALMRWHGKQNYMFYEMGWVMIFPKPQVLPDLMLHLAVIYNESINEYNRWNGYIHIGYGNRLLVFYDTLE